MRTENSPSGRTPSFIERARRAQILKAAIETIAHAGYAGASLARIAKHAGISKSVISYHFRGKDDLVREVIKEAIAKATEVIVPRVTAQPSYAAARREYIESDLAFMAAYPNHVIALLNITAAAYAGQVVVPDAFGARPDDLRGDQSDPAQHHRRARPGPAQGIAANIRRLRKLASRR
jgi:AcrR family transcriptional regulator